jgi:hypothetical protein
METCKLYGEALAGISKRCQQRIIYLMHIKSGRRDIVYCIYVSKGDHDLGQPSISLPVPSAVPAGTGYPGLCSVLTKQYSGRVTQPVTQPVLNIELSSRLPLENRDR